MLQNESILWVADNSGAKKLLVIRCLGGSNRRYSRIGDLVIATVKKSEPNADPQFSKGKIVLALVVATRRYFHRQNNTWIKFSKNYAVLVKKERKIKDEGKKKRKIIKVVKEPVGTRVFVPILAEFDQWGYNKILSLAPEIL
ncbi:50S ribosomal protein L14 [endosymbiont DhMRE of Dentiscutata heterogama]|uniref:large ribosomal subunit protein uL14 n=1 Tax=endosymbiont DhMRE of Dentiscutata heterogama TaxID=1609546 RepID=UPI000629DB44|nr:uL14 family ribosomal protein [endosymbiont DhMRE of Dentiscutata heterogama]CFW93088.1 50S ribosomal protein L14 [endosymbiont DhMRE of Dentiscutata heterogama]